MYNPHAFACERNNSSRIRKKEVGFRLSEAIALGSFPLFWLEEKRKRKRERERQKERRVRVRGDWEEHRRKNREQIAAQYHIQTSSCIYFTCIHMWAIRRLWCVLACVCVNTMMCVCVQTPWIPTYTCILPRRITVCMRTHAHTHTHTHTHTVLLIHSSYRAMRRQSGGNSPRGCPREISDIGFQLNFWSSWDKDLEDTHTHGRKHARTHTQTSRTHTHKNVTHPHGESK